MTLIFGHRGAPNLAPENTLCSFHRALESGADGIELDVQLSQDGVPIIIHDHELQRTTNGSGPVNKKNLHELQKLNASRCLPKNKSKNYIPSLIEVLESFYKFKPWLNLELKLSPGDNQEIVNRGIQQIISHIMEFPQWKNIIISSFNWSHLSFCKQIAPDIKLGLLVNSHRQITQAEKRANSLKFYSLHPHYSLTITYFQINRLTEESCEKAKLIPWTVNDPEILHKLSDSQNPPWGIITDYPEHFKSKN